MSSARQQAVHYLIQSLTLWQCTHEDAQADVATDTPLQERVRQYPGFPHRHSSASRKTTSHRPYLLVLTGEGVLGTAKSDGGFLDF